MPVIFFSMVKHYEGKSRNIGMS